MKIKLVIDLEDGSGLYNVEVHADNTDELVRKLLNTTCDFGLAVRFAAIYGLILQLHQETTAALQQQQAQLDKLTQHLEKVSWL